MELITALLRQLFGKEQAGGTTMSVTINMVSPTHCEEVSRYSTCGGDRTKVEFIPPLPLDEALLYANRYKEKGVFTHT